MTRFPHLGDGKGRGLRCCQKGATPPTVRGAIGLDEREKRGRERKERGGKKKISSRAAGASSYALEKGKGKRGAETAWSLVSQKKKGGREIKKGMRNLLLREALLP